MQHQPLPLPVAFLRVVYLFVVVVGPVSAGAHPTDAIWRREVTLDIRVEDLYRALPAELGRERLRLVQDGHPHRQHVLKGLHELVRIVVHLRKKGRQ